MNPKTDEALVREVQEGSISAFETIVKRYQKRLLAFTYRIVVDPELSQDVVIDTFFALYKTINRVDTTKKFSSYLFSMTKNAAISALRKQKGESKITEENAVVDDSSIYENLISENKREEVRGAIQKLKKPYQHVIISYYFDDLSYEEISHKLKLPINTVRTHLLRAKKQLRTILEHEKH